MGIVSTILIIDLGISVITIATVVWLLGWPGNGTMTMTGILVVGLIVGVDIGSCSVVW